MIRVVISAGDPAGVGPEIIAKSILRYHPSDVSFIIHGILSPFERLAERFPWARKFLKIPGKDFLEFHEIDVYKNLPVGKVDEKCGDIAFNSLLSAAQLVKEGRANALVTAPISKEAIQIAGHNYDGHTDFLAEFFGVEVTMMLFANRFRVSLVTTHIPLHSVPDEIKTDKILPHIRRTHKSLIEWFAAENPVIGVLALNPHAGEGGKIGDEEREIYAAIEMARGEGIQTIGPLVPDVAFLSKIRRSVDAYLAMYHDQGLIALKTLGFRQGVNITLGLPVPRTSPDHGTAFDIAGEGIASPHSFINALRTAVRIARKTAGG